MKRVCQNCRFWKRQKSEEHFPIQELFGECTHEKFEYSDIYDYRKTSDDSVLYSYYEGFAAFLVVGQNFGCVHFEALSVYDY